MIAGLAAPAVLTQVGAMLLGVVDTLMVARLGTAAIAAVSIGRVLTFGTLVLGMGVLLGMDPIVSQAHGARDGARCGLALQWALVLALLLAVPTGLAWLLTEEVLIDYKLTAVRWRLFIAQLATLLVVTLGRDDH